MSDEAGKGGLGLGQEIFVDAGPVVYRGEEARQHLRVTNDERFLVPGQGIPRVDHDRWELAQHSENLHWFEPDGSSRRVADDRNLIHANRFAGYEQLQGATFRHAVELGSGPFGNLRLIGRRCRIESCSLLDPAIAQYVSHRSSYFNQEYLFTAPESELYARVWGRAKAVLTTVPGLTGPRIPIRDLLPIGAEQLQGVLADLVVMINVLEHCQDADLVLERAWACVEPGGLFVLADKVHDAAEVERSVMRVYDAAHPLRVTRAAFQPILDEAEVLFESRTIDPISAWIPGTYETYWILRKSTS